MLSWFVQGNDGNRLNGPYSARDLDINVSVCYTKSLFRRLVHVFVGMA